MWRENLELIKSTSSLWDLLHSVWQTLGPSTSLQITQFHSFSWLSNISLYIYIYICICICMCIYISHIVYIHSSVIRHLGCFQVLAVVKSAAVNTGVHVSFWVMVFSGYMPSSGIARSHESRLQNHCRWQLQAWN